MICHAGAASAPAAPSRNVAASSAGGVAQWAETRTAKATPTATTPACATMRSRRGSTTSASAPAGTVKRNIGAMVATCTADTISGSQFMLVISQLVAVSNIAMPMLEIELATRIAVNATLPNTPQREDGIGIEGVWSLKIFGPVWQQSLIPAPEAANSQRRRPLQRDRFRLTTEPWSSPAPPPPPFFASVGLPARRW